jgi:signal transduction histidine kinase
MIRVVLADDTREVRILLRLALETHGGFEIVGEAEDGFVAIEQTRQQQPDLVLLDLAMPRKDGLQALPEIRQVAPEAKVVVLSGLNAIDSAAEAMAAGANAYLEKGVSANDVIKTLTAVCAGEEVAPVAERSRPAAAVTQPSESRRDIFAVLVHELRSPLTVVQGFADTLAQRLDELEPNTIRDSVNAIGRAARQARTVIDALDEAERVQVDGLNPHKEAVDLAALVRQAIGTRQVQFSQASEVWAEVDEAMIEKVIESLLSNATKFTPPGTPVSVNIQERAGNIDIAIADEGPGIPLDQRSRLFTKFGRLSSNVPGMGLGLYIARGIARAHGGDLRFVPGEVGARFVLTLPAGNVAGHDDG